MTPTSDYHEIFEKLPDGITLHDPDDGSILETNERFCKMLGYTREELLALEFDDLHVDEPPYTTDQAAEYIGKAATEGPQTFEWRDLTKSGDELPVEVHLRQTSINGEERILAVVRDITERKQRERELREKNERLEKFASVVSHDLRNPLNVAQGRLELLREDCDSDHIEAIERSQRRMQSLIDDLLTLAREGNDIMKKEELSLSDIVAECWQNVETANATINIETVQTISADRARVQQLLENVIRNAVEHAGHDVTVRIGDLDDGFFIEDSGSGIPEEEQDRVFQPGYSTNPDGTGFGLRIVKEIADGHEWSVTITESEMGGARFEIRRIQP